MRLPHWHVMLSELIFRLIASRKADDDNPTNVLGRGDTPSRDSFIVPVRLISPNSIVCYTMYVHDIVDVEYNLKLVVFKYDFIYSLFSYVRPIIYYGSYIH